MGTPSSLLIVGHGKRVAFHCNSDGALDHCMAALAGSVAAYGLAAFRQAMAEVELIAPKHLEVEDWPEDEERFDRSNGFVYADQPQWLDRAVRLAQSRDQAPIGLDDPLWGFEQGVPDFSRSGLAGLLTPRLVVSARQAAFMAQAPLTAGPGNGEIGTGYPFLVDLDRGVLEAWDEDGEDEEGEPLPPMTYRLDLTGLEGWDATALDGQVFALMHLEATDGTALQAELQTEATGPALVQQALDALAQGRRLACVSTSRFCHGPHQHVIWNVYLKQGREGTPPYRSPETALFHFGADARGPRQVAGALRAMIRVGLLPAETLDRVTHTQAPGGPHWLCVDQAPMASCATWRLMLLGELLWQHQQVTCLVPKSREDNGLAYLQRPDFLAAHQADRSAGHTHPLDRLAPDAPWVEQAAEALQTVDASAWLALPTGDALGSEPTRDAALAGLAQVLDRTVLTLVPALHAPVAQFLTVVAGHPLFQAVQAHLSPVALARLDYLRANPNRNPDW